MSEFNKTNVICCNLTNNRLKFNKLNTCRFLILFDIHLVTQISLEQNNFFLEHKLLQVHPYLMVYVNIILYNFEFFGIVNAKVI